MNNSTEFKEACKPFIEGGGAITERESEMASWRYFLEISSACNLRCPTCTKGNQAAVNGLKYDHQNGLMEWGLMEKCIDKIKSENPEAIVFLYGNSEPFLHPRLPECISAVKARGLRCEFSTNLNYTQRIPETLDAGPDFIIISLSGFTQEVYEKGHAGGNIERVKSNMVVLATINQTRQVKIAVNYHVYKDNQHEVELMRHYAEGLGLGFFTSIARAISMENAIQYCRENDQSKNEFEWATVFPPTSQSWQDTMARLKIPPTDARGMYANVPPSSVCPVSAGGMFSFIRHTGEISLCACVADRRINLGSYLDLTPAQMREKSQGHSICGQCLKYKLSYYFHIVGREKWNP